MANLFITEFERLGTVKNSRTPYPDHSNMVNQAVAIGAASAAASALTYSLVRLFAAANCHVSFTGVDATTSDMYLANGAEWIGCVKVGTVIKVKDTS